MKALLLGIVICAAAVFAVLPPETAGFGLGWGPEVLAFLRGGLPVIAFFIALIAVFIGIADIKDRAEAKKEETGENKREAETGQS
jgi:hypothetical protein